MNSLSLEIDDQRQSFRPGEKIAGKATWSSNLAAKRLEVRLFWWTSGAAPAQVGIVARYLVNNPANRQSARFEFVLPAGPWSFAGRLVTLHWAVELVAFPSRESGISLITVGPEQRRINPFRQETPEAEQEELA
jgi:hypothetical protein